MILSFILTLVAWFTDDHKQYTDQLNGKDDKIKVLEKFDTEDKGN